MLAHEAAAQAAVRAAFGVGVLYVGAGLAAGEIVAVKSDTAALPFQGGGDTLRQISFEVAQADLPSEPDKGELLLEGTAPWSADTVTSVWAVNDITRRDDIGAWVLIVEEEDPDRVAELLP